MARKRQVRRAAEELSQELGVNTRSFKCPNCSATVSFDPKNIATYCSFCGAHLPDAEKLLDLTYEFMKDEKNRKLQERRERAKTRRDIMEFIRIGFIVIFAGLWMVLIFSMAFRKY